MTITVRLDADLEKELERAADAGNVSKSEFVRRCLTEHLAREKARRTAWELGKDVFGRVGSGRSDLSRNRKQLLREKFRAKSQNRRRKTGGR